jgi:hypothetical protein
MGSPDNFRREARRKPHSPFEAEREALSKTTWMTGPLTLGHALEGNDLLTNRWHAGCIDNAR